MMTWHADPALLERFARQPEQLDDVSAASVEAHLVDCDECRATVAAAASDELASTWVAIAERIDQPRRTVAERVLTWFLPDHVARVVAATPALRASWLLAVTVVVGLIAAAARSADVTTPFLLLAPLVPLAGVAVSFGTAPDPAGETAVATPLHGAGLVLMRALAVFVSSFVVLSAGTLVLPDLGLRDAGWILPAVALTLGAVALSTWIAPVTATIVAGAAWLVGVQLMVTLDHTGRGLVDLPVFDAGGQAVFLLIVILGGMVLSARRDHFATLEAR